MRIRLSSWMASSAVLSVVAGAQAQNQVEEDPMQGMYRVNAEDPEAHLPELGEATKHPLDYGYFVMELNDRANVAVARKDWPTALKFHRAAAKMVPNRAISFSSLCQDYLQLGQREQATDACGSALYLEGATVNDFALYAHLVATRPGGLDAKEVEHAKAAIAHVKADKEARVAGFEMQCELGLREGDAQAVSECSSELRKAAPNSPRAISYAWGSAVLSHDFGLAQKLIKDAAQYGADPHTLDKMRRTTKAAEEGNAVELESVASEPSVPPTPPAPAATQQPAVEQTLTASESVHPMLRWLLGLVAALIIAVPVLRRMTRNA